MTQAVKAYSMLLSPTAGTTNTGLDQIVSIINTDPGLAGANVAPSIAAGALAANGINGLIVEAITTLGLGQNGVFTSADVLAINAFIRSDPVKLAAFTAFHGNDENGVETGFHEVQGDGATGKFRGENVINTVADGLYHIGFEVTGENFVNEDGNANASVGQVAAWLTALYTDHSTTGTGLDRTVDLIMADRGLSIHNPESQIEAGADAANAINGLIADAISTLGLGASGVITVDDVVQINAYIRSDPGRLATFIAAHGDDEGGVETGFHNVQGDGGSATYFGQNLVNTVLDGIYHVGFEIEGGHLLNEDGNQNASLTDVAAWLTYFYSDQSTTGTGFDRIVDTIKIDPGLARNDTADKIAGGAAAADGLNHILVDKIVETNATADGWIDIDDLVTINGLVRADDALFAEFLALHGDDEGGVETGFHQVQGDGGTTQYMGDALINTVADGIYHFGFAIVDGHFQNEDGDQNASLDDVSAWMNYFYTGKTIVFGTSVSDNIVGSDLDEQFVGDCGNDTIDAGAGNDLLYGGYGRDYLLGGAGDDILYGGADNDAMDGGEGSDVYRISGTEAAGWASFQGYDTYADTGATGSDRIEAVGDSDVDIGLRSFGPSSGIETIDGTRALGTVRLLGDWKANTLDFSATTFVGGNIVIDGGDGNDIITGSAAADTVIGGLGDDKLNGGGGGDTFEVSGSQALGWSSFQGFDTYADSGPEKTDTIKAMGSDAVDIGLASFGPANGIDIIDASGTSGKVTLLGDWKNNTLDFSATTFIGSNIVIDGGYGNDIIKGNAADNIIIGGGGSDTLDGKEGNDTYRVSGNYGGGWETFQDFDTYNDTGASKGDMIEAVGVGDVDIGLKSFSASNGIDIIKASNSTGVVRLLGDWNNNVLNFSATTFQGSKIVIDGGYGNDTITGNAGANTIIGGGGNDKLDGAGGSDTYQVTGNMAGGWSSFQDYDTYADTGASGVDTIQALGLGNVDIGLLKFDATCGIEVVDGSGATGFVRLVGDWSGNTLDFRGVTFKGGNIVIDGAGGNDIIKGTSGADVIVGGTGMDSMDGGNGGDVYQVTGNVAGGWGSFSDYDTYTDTGASGVDTIRALGDSVDIGFKSFGPTSGIEVIDTSLATGTTRLLGSWTNDKLDFSTVQILGSAVLIDGGDGNDTIIGNAGANRITGGNGNDTLTGGAGSDSFLFRDALSIWNNVDKITDFSVPGDTIELSSTIFKAAGALGTLATTAFQAGTKANDALDRIIYDSATGSIYYDADGNGSGAQVLFATVPKGLAITNADFVVV